MKGRQWWGHVVYISAYITGMIYVDKYFILDGYITQVSTNTNTYTSITEHVEWRLFIKSKTFISIEFQGSLSLSLSSL